MRSALSICVAAASIAWAPAVRAGDSPNKGGKATIPESASEGPREIEKTSPALKKLVEAQPYGKMWRDLTHVDPAPKDRRGLGEAATHPDLSRDPIELQQQAQYLEETGSGERYGFVSIRVVRVYRFGKVGATRLVLEMIGKGNQDAFKKDVESLAAAWTNAARGLDLYGKFTVTKNDLVEQKANRPKEFPMPPLVIELVPMERSGP